MEKYIFDCRQDLSQSPKYLKRNHKVNNLPMLQDAQNAYMKNKVFLTFDYSYYQTVPKTASLHVVNRIRDLNYLTQHCDSLKQKNQACQREFSSSLLEGTKWKKDKQNRLQTGESQRKFVNKNKKKKIRLPVDCMPGVGDYHYQPTAIQKRITYDVKIRGKPTEVVRSIDPQPNTQQTQMAHTYHSSTFLSNSQRNAKLISGLPKQDRISRKRHQSDQQYHKFIQSIDTTNVWSRLMDKYKLKGSKFDLYGYGS